MRVPLIAAMAGVAALALAAPASATPVFVLQGRTVVRHDDRLDPPFDLPAAPAGAPRLSLARHRPKRHRARRGRTQAALTALLAHGQITRAQYDASLASYKRALRAAGRLRGRRQVELQAVIANVDAMAASGKLTPDRLAPIFMTLDRNTQWWTNAPFPAPGDHVGFSGSQLLWQYYPGQGIELQALANFSKANGLYGQGDYTDLRALLGELMPLAAQRGGTPAWEYYFRFDGGVPPWTSGMSQATALEALAHASKALNDPSFNAFGLRALGIFQVPPPTGVRVAMPNGAHYLLYSFAPHTFVINGFLQAVLGLHDFAAATGDPTANSLFQAGDSEAQAELPRYDTGAWSLYSLGQEADLSYHQLVITFLSDLCKRTHEAVYCTYAQRFTTYLHTPPNVVAFSARIRTSVPARLGFRIDKISRVEVSVLKGAQPLFATSALLSHGNHSLVWAHPARPGTYVLQVVATDLAGNRTAVTATLTIVPRKRGRRGH